MEMYKTIGTKNEAYFKIGQNILKLKRHDRYGPSKFVNSVHIAPDGEIEITFIEKGYLGVTEEIYISKRERGMYDVVRRVYNRVETYGGLQRVVRGLLNEQGEEIISCSSTGEYIPYEGENRADVSIKFKQDIIDAHTIWGCSYEKINLQ